MAKKNIGSIMKPKKEGDSYYIALAPGVTVSVNGVAINTKYINMDDPHTLPEKLLSMGKINEEVAESMKQRAQTRTFVKYDLSVRDKA